MAYAKSGDHRGGQHRLLQCIGDTLGPGGVFRALRSIPAMLDLARVMEDLCPGATLLNYVNPMAMIGWALGECYTTEMAP
ncbi:family 4 glycosyl hydrolase [Cohnella nanjingensis]|uniref:family 4 glycosyl hydrolase n=1 Tax=Cohnella nanjingensis TaxID=1387779 RepID=UPI0028A87AB9|nr:hypothetical protein [Cohnella nanjingensis]